MPCPKTSALLPEGWYLVCRLDKGHMGLCIDPDEDTEFEGTEPDCWCGTPH
jgi:hypothetical protein